MKVDFGTVAAEWYPVKTTASKDESSRTSCRTGVPTISDQPRRLREFCWDDVSCAVMGVLDEDVIGSGIEGRRLRRLPVSFAFEVVAHVGVEIRFIPCDDACCTFDVGTDEDFHYPMSCLCFEFFLVVGDFPIALSRSSALFFSYIFQCSMLNVLSCTCSATGHPPFGMTY